MPLTATCPGCGRPIPVTTAEVRSGLTLECAGCDTRFPAGENSRAGPGLAALAGTLLFCATFIACGLAWAGWIGGYLGPAWPLAGMGFFVSAAPLALLLQRR